MAYSQGSVVLAADLFKDGMRPYVVVSNSTRPFHGESYTVAVMSTTEWEDAIKIEPGRDIAEGRLNETSYVQPWALNTFDDETIMRRVAQLNPQLVDDICEQAKQYIEPIGLR